MIKNEYEVITHNNANFHVFMVNLLYRTPHIHKDYEISLVLEGELSVSTPNGTLLLCSKDIFLMNPFYSHEITAEKPVLILSLQISPAFFSAYYPPIENTEFDSLILRQQDSAAHCQALRKFMFELAQSYFQKEPLYEIKCAALINQLFFYLLQKLPHHQLSEKSKQTYQVRGKRMRNITQYIDDHYMEKLLLSDIAKLEELDLYYLSHFFKECFGMSFQNYITRIRCEHARQLLLLTDYSLLDISISCGFSDAKYFNKGFQSQYGCTPKEYRKNFHLAKLEQQQKSMLTTQEFLSDAASLLTLEHLFAESNSLNH